MTRHSSLSFLTTTLGAALAGCSPAGPAEPAPTRPPEPAVLDLDEWFVLGVGAPSDLHAHMRHGYDTPEPVTVLSARCADDRCSAVVMPGGAIRVEAREGGDLELTVTAQTVGGVRIEKTFAREAGDSGSTSSSIRGAHKALRTASSPAQRSSGTRC